MLAEIPLEAHRANARVGAVQPLEHRERPVRGAVVDEDQLERPRPRLERGERPPVELFHAARLVEDGDDDRDVRRRKLRVREAGLCPHFGVGHALNPSARSLERGTRARGGAPKLSPVPAATTRRRLLLAIAFLSFAIVFASVVLYEVPGLGIGHFFYIPVALLALAGGTWAGLSGGVLAAALYALAIVVTPRLPTRDALTFASAIRFLTFTSCGVLVGWFANQHRRHVD